MKTLSTLLIAGGTVVRAGGSFLTNVEVKA
jgi:hypothetical protein